MNHDSSDTPEDDSKLELVDVDDNTLFGLTDDADAGD
jgi:hypothetical protein